MADGIEVQIPPDAGGIMFGEEGKPILTYTEGYPGQGAGWVLYYLDATDGVETHFIGGKWSELDWALEQGLEWLNRCGR